MQLSEFLAPPASAKWRRVRRYKGAITQKQALHDLAELRYIIGNRYSGLDYWRRQGVDFDACYAEIRAFIAKREEVLVRDFCRAIHQTFAAHVVDNHLAFACHATGRLGCSKVKHAYFTDIVVDEAHRVITSAAEGVNIGDEIACTGEAGFYPTLSPADQQYYLVGCRAWEVQTALRVLVNGQGQNLPLHRCRAGIGTRGEDICLAQSEVDGVPIVRSNCCDFVPPLRSEQGAFDLGRRLSNSAKLIWDNTYNEGGYSRISEHFIKGLNGYAHAAEDWAKLRSPLTEHRPCKRRWETHTESDADPAQGSYDGTLYFLMNSGTASSGETSVLFAKALRRAVFIGEHTMGCNTFGSVASYQLRHSGIALWVPHIINIPRPPLECEEGIGFVPDFWVDEEDVQRAVMRWLGESI